MHDRRLKSGARSTVSAASSGADGVPRLSAAGHAPGDSRKRRETRSPGASPRIDAASPPAQAWRELRDRPARTSRLVLEGLLAGIVSLGCAAVVLQLWRADLSVPLRYAPVDDTKFYLMLVKGIAEHGSYLSNPHLGVPFGQQLSDYPQGADNLNLAIVRFLALFTTNAALIVNLFFLLTFALVGFIAHLVLRSLGLSAMAGGVAAVLYSLLAYHFFRGESHLLLSAYYAVPLAAYLFLRLLGEESLFARREGAHRRWLAWGSTRSLATVAICVLIGSENLYYATFAVVMIAGVNGAGKTTSIAKLAKHCMNQKKKVMVAAVVVVIVSSVGANLAPTLVYRSEHGTNTTLERSAAFTERSDEAFSLRPANLILPVPGSRIAPLRRIAGEYDHAIAPGYCESCYASLGTVGTVGFLWLALYALAALAGAGAAWRGTRRLLRHAGVGVLLALALGSVGAAAGLIEVFITPDIRAWNRISVLIAFLSLLAVGVLLDRLRAVLHARRGGAQLAGLLFACVLAFGVYDQTSASFVPGYRADARQWRSDARFVSEIEARLPHDASVLQLPYVPFPEGYPETPVGDQLATYSTKYEALRGYLHSSTLRWSYGATKGRAGDWSAQLAGQPLPYVLAAASAAGFDGLWVDPAGFEPGKAARLRAALQSALGQAPLLSPRGDLWFFDLRGNLRRLRQAHPAALLSLLRARTLRPLSAACHAGGVELHNPSNTAVEATLTMHLARTGHSVEANHAGAASGQASDIPPAATVTVSDRLRVRPGSSFLRLANATGSAIPPALLYATLTDDALRSFAGDGGASAVTLITGLTGPVCAGSH